MEKPANKKIREFVYAATTLNDLMERLPPSFDESQKLQAGEFLYAVHQTVEQPYRDIVKFHGFKLGDGNISDYIEICERATVTPCYNSEESYTVPRKRKSEAKKKSKKKEEKKRP